MTAQAETESNAAPPDGDAPPDDPRDLCRACAEPIEPGSPVTTNAYCQVVHAACMPPVPPCPEGTDPEHWSTGAKALRRAPRESDASYSLRLELYCRFFAPGSLARSKGVKLEAPAVTTITSSKSSEEHQ